MHMHITFAKAGVGISSSLGAVALSFTQLYEPIKFVGVCGGVLVSLLTAVSLGFDIRKKWLNRNK